MRNRRLKRRRLPLLMIAMVAAMFVLPVASFARTPDYAGPDAGYLVCSVGTVRIGMHFDFSYRRVATADGARVQDWNGKIEPRVGGAIYLKVKNPDFTGEETGHVVVTRLPPGQYEVHDFAFAGSTPLGGSVHWSPARPFALPFAIRSGEATYIGSFMRAPSLGTRLHPILGAAGYFILANRAERDLPIARLRLPSGMPLKTEVTDVTQFGSRALRTAEP